MVQGEGELQGEEGIGLGRGSCIHIAGLVLISEM